MAQKSLSEIYEEMKDKRRIGASGNDSDEEIEEILIAVRQNIDLLRAREFSATASLLEMAALAIEAHLENPGRLTDFPFHLEVHALAHRIFGDPEKAERWLARPNSSFAGQAPIDLLKDELGIAVVREALEQIDHGIFA